MTSYLVVVVKVQNCLGLGFILTINFCLSSNLGFQVCEYFFGFGSGFRVGKNSFHHYCCHILITINVVTSCLKSSKEASCRFHASLSTTNSYHIRRSVDEPRMTDCRQNRRGQQMSDRRLVIRPSAGGMGGRRRNFPSPDLRPNSN